MNTGDLHRIKNLECECTLCIVLKNNTEGLHVRTAYRHDDLIRTKTSASEWQKVEKNLSADSIMKI